MRILWFLPIFDCESNGNARRSLPGLVHFHSHYSILLSRSMSTVARLKQPDPFECSPLQIMGIKHLTFAGLIFLSLTIGLPLILLGCNPDIGECLTYDFVHGTAYGYRLATDTCKHCYSTGSNSNQETCGPEYTCYKSFVQLNYGGPGDNCEYSGKKNDIAEESMANIRRKYPPNSTNNFILHNGIDDMGVCESVASGKDMWTAGLVLCVLATAIFIGWCVFFYCTYEELMVTIAQANSPNGLHEANRTPPLTNEISAHDGAHAGPGLEMTRPRPLPTPGGKFANPATVVPDQPASVNH